MNYYEILELSRTASRDEVKGAYKKMAAVVHPDKGGSAMLFRLVQEAYEVLSDPVKRKQYDSDLVGPSGGNRQAGSQQQQQQQQRQTSQSELNDIRVEDFYKRWKGNLLKDEWAWSNRKAMPREESYAAGGVRKMIRESSPFVSAKQFCGTCRTDSTSPYLFEPTYMKYRDSSPLWSSDPNRFCGNCGIETPSKVCDRCNQARGFLREIKLNHTEDCWLKEKIKIESGDLLWYIHLNFQKRNQAVFGYVVKGEATTGEGLWRLRVLDEFSGVVLGVSDWGFVMGHWKSNDLSRSRTGSMRNWSFTEGNRVND